MRTNIFIKGIIILIFFHVQLTARFLPYQHRFIEIEMQINTLSAQSLGADCEAQADADEAAYGSGNKSGEDVRYENTHKNCRSVVDNAGADTQAAKSSNLSEVVGYIVGLLSIAIFIMNLTWITSCAGQIDTIISTIFSAISVTLEIIWLVVQNAELKKNQAELKELTVQTGVSEERQAAQIEAVEIAKNNAKTLFNWSVARSIGSGIVTLGYIIAAIVAFVQGALGKTPWYSGQDVCKGGAFLDRKQDRTINNPEQKYAKKSILDLIISKVNAEDENKNEKATFGEVLEAFGPVGAALFILIAALKGPRKGAQEGISRGVFHLVYVAIQASALITNIKNSTALNKQVLAYEELIEILEENEGIYQDLGSTELADNSELQSESLDMQMAENFETNVNPELQKKCSTGDISRAQPGITDKPSGGCPVNKKSITGVSSKLSSIKSISGTDAIVSASEDSEKALRDLQQGKGLSASYVSKYANSAAINKFKKLKNNFLKSLKKDVPSFPSVEEIDKRVAVTRAGIMKDIESKLKGMSAEELNKLKPNSFKDKVKKDREQIRRLFSPKVMKRISIPEFGGLSGVDNNLDDLNNDQSLELSNDDEKLKEINNSTFEANDIEKDTGRPLWQILTLRYRKSAFPVLLEKIVPKNKKKSKAKIKAKEKNKEKK